MLAERKLEVVGQEPKPEPRDVEAELDDNIGDDLLRLVFVSCHPVLAVEARVALTLRLVGGLTTEEIARAFLVPEPTVAQRIVRAKRTLDRKSTRLNSSHSQISYAVFCLKKKKESRYRQC